MKSIFDILANHGTAIAISAMVIFLIVTFAKTGNDILRSRFLGKGSNSSNADIGKEAMWAIVFKVLDNAPIALIMTDQNRVIKKCTQYLCDLSGYPKDALIGNQVEMLIPDRYHDKHSIDYARYIKTPSRRKMNEHGRNETILLTKSKEEIPVTIGLDFFNDDNTDKYGIAFISEKKKSN